MADVRIKDLATGTPDGTEFVPFDSVSGGTKKNTAAVVVVAGLAANTTDLDFNNVDLTKVARVASEGESVPLVIASPGGQLVLQSFGEMSIAADGVSVECSLHADALTVGTPALGWGADANVETLGADRIVVGCIGLYTLQPAQITSDQTAYAPTGYGNATEFEITSDATRAIRSMAASLAIGAPRILRNVGSFNIVLKHEYTSGTTASERFKLPRDRDLVLRPAQSVILTPDFTNQRWMVIAPPAVVPKQIANSGAAITASTYTIQPGDDVILGDTTSNAVALTRPALGDGIERVIVKVAGGTNGITLVRVGSEKINGVAATYTLPGSATAWASATPQAWMFLDDGTDTQVM